MTSKVAAIVVFAFAAFALLAGALWLTGALDGGAKKTFAGARYVQRADPAERGEGDVSEHTLVFADGGAGRARR